MHRAQVIDQDPSTVHLFFRDVRDVGFLIFQPAFWGKGPASLILRQPCLAGGSLSPARGVGMGTMQTGISWLLFSGGFPWQFSVTLLRVRAAVAIS